MFDPDCYTDSEVRTPHYYRAALVWIVLACLVIGLVFYLISEA